MSLNKRETASQEGAGLVDMSALDYSSWKIWEESQFGKFTSSDASYFAKEVNHYVVNDNPVTVLEIGFGNGSFLGWAKSQGFLCHGVEINSILRGRAAGLLGAVHASVFDEELNSYVDSFDLIIAFDVLEHVPAAELPRMMERIRDLLKPGGVFLARFPNGDSPFGRVYQHGDITHMNTIGKYMVTQLAQWSKMEVVEIRSPAFPLDSPSLKGSARRFLIKLVRRILEKSVSFVFFNGFAIALDPNLVAVWRKPSAKL